MKKFGIFLVISMVLILLSACAPMESLGDSLSKIEINDLISKFEKLVSSAVATAQDILTRQVTYKIVENVCFLLLIILTVCVVFYLCKMYEKRKIIYYTDRRLNSYYLEEKPERILEAKKTAREMFEKDDSEAYAWVRGLTIFFASALGMIPLTAILQCLINPGYQMLMIIRQIVK